MTSALAGFMLTACLSANPEQPAPPSLEVSAAKDGIEICVGKMRIVGQRFSLDQANQILVVEGGPAVLQMNLAAEPRTTCRGTRITVNLANDSVSIGSAGNAARNDAKEK